MTLKHFPRPEGKAKDLFMGALETLSRGVLLKTLSNLVVMGFGLAMPVLLTRHFGKEAYGLLVLTYSVTSLLVVLADLGAKPSINRFVPRSVAAGDRGKAAEIVLTGSFFQAAGIAIFALLLLVLSGAIARGFFHQQALIPFLRAGALFLMGYAGVEFIFQLFQALQRWSREFLVSTLYPALYFFLTVAAILLLDISLVSVLYCNFAAAAAVIALGARLLPRELPPVPRVALSPGAFRELAWQVARFGWPVLGGNLIFVIESWLDKALLGRYHTAEVVAHFYIGALFINAAMLLIKVLYTVLMPYAASLSVKPREEVLRQFRFTSRVFLHSGILIAIAGFFLIEPVITFLFGPGYGESAFAFRLLLSLFLIRAFQQNYGIFLVNVLGRSGLSLILATISTALLIPLLLILIPGYGFRGAVGAAVVSRLLSLALFIAATRTYGSIVDVASVAKSLGSLGITGLFCLLLKWGGLSSLPLFLLLSLGSYFLLIVLFRELGREDLAVVRAAISSYFGAEKRGII